MPKTPDRSYRRHRAMARFLEALGWLLMGAGLVGILLGTMAGLSLFAAPEGGAGGASAHLLGALPGLFVLGAGLSLVLRAHGALASYDTAEMTRDLLRLNRRGAPAQEPPRAANTVAATPAAAGPTLAAPVGAKPARPAGRAEPSLRAPAARSGS